MMTKEYIGVRGETVGCDIKGNPFYNMYLTDEEIIRCKDCKNFIPTQECKFFNNSFIEPNGYCYWAEHK